MRPETIHMANVSLRAATSFSVAAIYVPYLQSLGCTIGDIFLVNVVFQAAIASMEVPTGIIADRYGRGGSVRIGILLHGGGFALYGAVDGLAGACAAEALCGIGYACISGAQNAWLKAALVADGRSDAKAMAKAKADATAMETAVNLVAPALFGWLCWDRPRLGFAIAAAFAAVNWMLAWQLDERGEYQERETNSLAESRDVARSLWRDPWMRWMAAARAGFPLWGGFNYGWAPFFGRLVPAPLLGTVSSFIMLSFGVGGWLSRRIHGQTPIAIAPLFAAAGLAFVAIVLCGGSVFGALASAAVFQICRGSLPPAIESAIQERAPEKHRATAESLVSMWGSASAALLGIVFGLSLRGEAIQDIRQNWLVAGSFMALAGLALWLFRPKAEHLPSLKNPPRMRGFSFRWREPGYGTSQ